MTGDRLTMNVPTEAVGLKLHRIDAKDQLHACELVIFKDGNRGVEITLKRAAISGRVEVGGNINDHFADIYDNERSLIETVALDARSYSALKNKWMRCKIE